MKNTRTVIGLAVLAGVASVAQGQTVFYEDFESYASGSNIHGQGGWKGWDNTASAGATITKAQAVSGVQSVNVSGASDLVHEFAYSGGQYQFSFNQFIPTTATGTTYLILLNKYRDGGSGDWDNWSIQIPINVGTGVAVDDMSTTEPALNVAKGAWANWTFTIDLNANLVGTYYNGTLWNTHAWQSTGENAIAAIDLYANNASAVYYDDIKIQQTPEPTVLALIGLGGLALGLRRRNS
jgi:hypothetical protein